MEPNTTLIAILGGQPQRITFLLDLLLARGETIDQVVIIYIAAYPRSQRAIQCLENEFKEARYGGKPCQFRRFPLHTDKSDLIDIRDPDEVEIVRKNIHHLLAELKGENQRLHIGLSSGRRLISLITLAAAMQYLTPVDHLWHINIPAEVIEKSRDGAILHVPPEAGVHLLPVPFVPWVSYFPGLVNLLKSSPQEVGEASFGWLSDMDRDRCIHVWEALTPRQKQVLQAFARGFSRHQVAQQLCIAVSTVDSHRDGILRQCGLVWEAQAGEGFDTKFIQKYFGPFLAGLMQT